MEYTNSTGRSVPVCKPYNTAMGLSQPRVTSPVLFAYVNKRSSALNARVRTHVLYFSTVGKSVCFRVETIPVCGECVWFCVIHHVISSWRCTFSACVQHMFSIRRREGLKVMHRQLKTRYYFVLHRSLTCHHWTVHFHQGAHWQTATNLCYAAVHVQDMLFCVHFTVFYAYLFC